MNDPEFHLLEQIEEDHWWFVGKRLILRAVLRFAQPGARMLDLGCGTGGLLRDWQGALRCSGVDRSRLALQICKRQGFDRLVQGDLTALPFRSGAVDVLLALDVIEHLDDDVEFLRRAAGLCVAGGRLVVAVPAFQLLWSQHDETFEHRRRYTARQLESAIRAAGLNPERTTYTNAFVFPIAAIWRVLSYRFGLGRFSRGHDFWKIPKVLNALLIGIYRIESWLLGRLDLPVGVSVVCVARKPG